MNQLVATILTLTLAVQSPIDLLKQAQILIDQAISALTGPVVTSVPAGGDLQAAIDTLPPGATIALTAGATYGAITLRGGPGHIITAGAQPPENIRVTPAAAATFAKVKVAGGGGGALQTAPGTHDWTIVGVEFLGDAFDVVAFGSATSTTVEAENFVLDRVYIHGDPVTGAKRGVTLNARNVQVLNSYISDFKRKDQDTQAVAGANGPGPYVIRNNYLEGAGENVMFGGDNPRVLNLVPTDIDISYNTIFKPLEWRGVWNVKNLLELKNARNVRIHHNAMSNSWKSGQTGYGIVLSVRNQTGPCTWCTLEDITVSENTVEHTGGAINFLARDDAFPSGVMARVSVLFNKFLDVNKTVWGGDGRMFLLQGGGSDVEIRGNILEGAGSVNSFLTFDQPQWKWPGFKFMDNVVPEGYYGIVGGGGMALGAPVIAFYAPDAVWSNVTVLRTVRTDKIVYPLGTTVTR